MRSDGFGSGTTERTGGPLVELAGKVAIVTGGGHGIGAAVAEGLAAEGVDVVVNYAASKDAAEETVGKITARGVRAIAVQADVSSSADVRAMFDRTLEAFGRVDILINNAAARVARVPFGEPENLPEEVWDRTMAVNLKGPFLCTAAAVGPMRANGGGAIVNVGSVGGLRPRSSNLAYATAKAGLVHLTESLANGLGGDNIRVNCLVPGITPTSRVLPNTPTVGPLGRHVAMDDLVRVAVECCRNESVTGTTWVVDAGALLGM
jgi:3-oxoacyl-[acyl-carrier protein] reductase